MYKNTQDNIKLMFRSMDYSCDLRKNIVDLKLLIKVMITRPRVIVRYNESYSDELSVYVSLPYHYTPKSNVSTRGEVNRGEITRKKRSYGYIYIHHFIADTL